jgi:hypothetical protein
VLERPQHELTRLFDEHHLPLNPVMSEMLNEHFSHRTERRGCGYTQATRHLATLVNDQRNRLQVAWHLFPGWRAGDGAIVEQVSQRLTLEESELLVGIIIDLLGESPPVVDELPSGPEAMRIGTCPLAEKYFLEIAAGFVRRRGRANIIVGADAQPLLIEKVGLGDDHSCLSLTELVLNGVRLPSGCLFGVRYDPGATFRANRALPGTVVPVAACQAFRLLRLTTLAVSPQHRARAFSTHFQAQLDAGLFAPGQVTIAQLLQVAREQL